jgi:hypothetical protein
VEEVEVSNEKQQSIAEIICSHLSKTIRFFLTVILSFWKAAQSRKYISL